MSHKQTLKDLQQRLSDRLQSAQTQTASIAWLAVLVRGSQYLLSLSQAGEIFSAPSIVRVPYTKPWFCGVTNLRGSLYSIIDLAAFIDCFKGVEGSAPAQSHASLVTVNTDSGVNCALLLDDLMGLRRQEAFGHVEPAPSDAPSWFGQRLIDCQGQSWQELDLYALTQTDTFLNIGT